MHLTHIDLFIFILFISIFSVVALIVKLRSSYNNALEYLVMGRTLTLPLFVITLVSSWYGSVIGATQIAYKHGIYNFIVLGCFWYVSAIVFAVFVWRKFASQNSLSLPELIGSIHGQSSERLLVLLMFIKGLPIAYIIALSLMISTILEISNSAAMLIVGIIAVSMGMRTSLRSVLMIDFMQFITIFLGMVVVVIYCVSNLGGFEYLQHNLPHSHLTVTGENNILKLVLWFLVALSSTILSPIFYQRCAALKKSKQAKVGILISIGFWIVSDVLTTAGGLYARAYLGDGHGKDAYIRLFYDMLPVGMVGYMLAAMLIMAVSALDSYTFAVKSLVINYYRNQGKVLAKRHYLICSLVVTITSIVIAINLESNLEKAWLLFESAFLASTIIPIIISIYWKGLLKSSQFNYIVGTTFVLTLLADYYYLSHNTTCNLVMLSLNACLIGVCILYKRWQSISRFPQEISRS